VKTLEELTRKRRSGGKRKEMYFVDELIPSLHGCILFKVQNIKLKAQNLLIIYPWFSAIYV
jgi:hypothetical protein